MSSLKNNYRFSARLALSLTAMVFLLLLAGQGCASPQADKPQGVTVEDENGQMAPDFTLPDLEGNPVRLSDLRGDVVFINFWATWCPPCRAEMPDIEVVHQQYKDQGVTVLGIDIRESENAVSQYVNQGGFSWTFVIDKTGEVAASYGITVIPTSFFIGREGTIQTVKRGLMTKRDMEAQLNEAMQ